MCDRSHPRDHRRSASPRRRERYSGCRIRAFAGGAAAEDAFPRAAPPALRVRARARASAAAAARSRSLGDPACTPLRARGAAESPRSGRHRRRLRHRPSRAAPPLRSSRAARDPPPLSARDPPPLSFASPRTPPPTRGAAAAERVATYERGYAALRAASRARHTPRPRPGPWVDEPDRRGLRPLPRPGPERGRHGRVSRGGDVRRTPRASARRRG